MPNDEGPRDVVSEGDGKVVVQAKEPKELYNFRVQQDAIKAHSVNSLSIR
jgi:hypothetical protein